MRVGASRRDRRPERPGVCGRCGTVGTESQRAPEGQAAGSARSRPSVPRGPGDTGPRGHSLRTPLCLEDQGSWAPVRPAAGGGRAICTGPGSGRQCLSWRFKREKNSNFNRAPKVCIAIEEGHSSSIINENNALQCPFRKTTILLL